MELPRKLGFNSLVDLKATDAREASLTEIVVRPIPGFLAEGWAARLAARRWRQRFPWVRVERD